MNFEHSNTKPQKTELHAVTQISFAEALKVWAKIGFLSFGGPAGQIALMHREIVEERKWLTEEEYLNALNFCMLLPGPEAMQLATYSGWRLHGVLGGLMAGLLFVLPGAFIVLALTMAYASFGKIPYVEAAFIGIKAAVLMIVIEALLRISKRALHHHIHWIIAACAFIAIFFFNVPFPLIILAAGLTGFFLIPNGTVPSAQLEQIKTEQRPRTSQTLKTLSLWLALWLIPIGSLVIFLGPDHILSQIGLFFSKLAVVTFGGAYAVLAYMGQAVVETHGWLKPGEMLDGLGLAETTPGPLILVTEFVGYLAGARSGGGYSIMMGLAGAAVTLWATFAPCFLWIFVGAPYISQLPRYPRLKTALQGITSAVVGIILNLSLWFGLHVFAPDIKEVWFGPLRLWSFSIANLDFVAIALSGVALIMLFILHQGIFRTLLLCALLGFGLKML